VAGANDFNFDSVASNKPCAMTLSMKVVHRDKPEMVQALRQSKLASGLKTNVASTTTPTTMELKANVAPRFASEDASGPGWYTFEKPVLYV
jgi:hypothetical protein